MTSLWKPSIDIKIYLMFIFSSIQNHFDHCKRKLLKCPNVCGSFLARNKVSKPRAILYIILRVILYSKKVYLLMTCPSKIFLDQVSRWKQVSADSGPLSLCSDGLYRKGMCIVYAYCVCAILVKCYLYGCRYLKQKNSFI